jgi:alpha-tubulin suppressor-like RCC1 family protein
VMGGYRWRMLDIGRATCGVRKNGSLWCWGEMATVLAGAADASEAEPEPEYYPMRIGTRMDWVSVAVGDDHLCAIDEAGKLWCWGHNARGQLGDGTRQSILRPSDAVPQLGRWTAVTASSGRTCAIAVDEALWCWGQPVGHSQDEPVNDELWPTRGEGAFAHVALGWGHGCAVRTDGTVACWGDNTSHQIGNDAMRLALDPVDVPGTGPAVRVDVGSRHSCAVGEDGSLGCWGAADSGRLGNGIVGWEPQPVRVAGDRDWRTVWVGWDHTCGIDAQDGLWCWGAAWHGQLGQEIAIHRPRPEPVAEDRRWHSVEPGTWGTCAIDAEGGLWCWGYNVNGVLGLGRDVTEVLVPTRVPGPERWTMVSLGAGSCGIAEDGGAWCWGENYEGWLGVSGPGIVWTPQPVPSNVTWRWLRRGGGRTYAIDTEGDAWHWGFNDLEDYPSDEAHRTPQPLFPGLKWRTVGPSNFGLDEDGVLHTWPWLQPHEQQPVALDEGGVWRALEVGVDLERSHEDRDGDWPENHRQVCVLDETGGGICRRWQRVWDPEEDLAAILAAETALLPENGGAGWAHLSIGIRHACGIDLEGGLWCWGYDDRGQLGLGTAFTHEPWLIARPR